VKEIMLGFLLVAVVMLAVGAFGIANRVEALEHRVTALEQKKWGR